MRVARRSWGLLLPLLLGGCASGDGEVVHIEFWAMGREGEVVQELIPRFEEENPGLRVNVQQVPWSAAHEKLLTAFVGRSTPDVTQLGNTWVSEFSALGSLAALDSMLANDPDLSESVFFSGILDSNRIDGTLYGLPWYVDTRLLFYRRDLLAKAGFDRMPGTWEGWREALRAVTRLDEVDYALFLPLNEWVPPVVMGMQAGSSLLSDHDTRGAFSQPEFARAFDFYLSLFEEGLCPPVGNQEVANLYQEFARGYITMFITGPWNLGEFSRRLPEELQDDWSTAPLPGPEGPGVSVAGGSSLVVFEGSPRKEAAWKLVRYLSRPDVQTEFYELCGDLPARKESWTDANLANDERIVAFKDQLERAVPTPKIPEWEQIAYQVQDYTERAVRAGAPRDEVLRELDRSVDILLDKRRWLMESRRETGAGS